MIFLYESFPLANLHLAQGRWILYWKMLHMAITRVEKSVLLPSDLPVTVVSCMSV